MKKIDRFNGDYAFLSNFFNIPVRVWGVTYPTSEHAYQAAKTATQVDHDAILSCATPGNAKRLGRRVQIRPRWDEMRVSVMREVQQAKFSNPYMASALLKTGDVELIEGNTWNDTWWGMCNGIGENHLGKILMQVREEVRARVEAS